jgi:hypothetical protein
MDCSDDLMTWLRIAGCSVILPKLFSFENNAYKLIFLAFWSLSLPYLLDWRTGESLSKRDWGID